MSLESFRQTRAKLKRTAILEAAITLFRRDGYAGASMEEIAQVAEVSTATLYRHFRSKADLFEAVASHAIDQLETELSEATSVPPLQHLRELAHAYARLLSDPNTISVVRMIVSETGRNPDLANRFYDAVKSRLGDVFAEAVENCDRSDLLASTEYDAAPGQLQGMIEHAILMRGLILGDAAGPAAPPDIIVEEAFNTWCARWLT